MTVKEEGAIKVANLLESYSAALEAVVARVAPSVVTVWPRGRTRRPGGSGIMWASDGLILTNAHVVQRGDAFEVARQDGLRFETRLVGRDPYSDLAVLQIETSELRPAQLGDSDQLRVGQFVLAVANPLGGPVSATAGIITSLGRPFRTWGGGLIEKAIATDAALTPGYSGGPLVNARGQVIGISTSVSNNRGIAIPVNTADTLARQLVKAGKVRRAYLGISGESVLLPENIAERPDVHQETGILLFTVEPRSPAASAGLMIGDVLIKLGEKPIGSFEALLQSLTDQAIAVVAELKILRGGEIKGVRITPVELE